MLDNEKLKRSQLASEFQEKMNKLSADISGTKDDRQKEYEENQAIRSKISTVIDEYKAKESNYKAKMEVFNEKIKTF